MILFEIFLALKNERIFTLLHTIHSWWVNKVKNVLVLYKCTQIFKKIASPEKLVTIYPSYFRITTRKLVCSIVQLAVCIYSKCQSSVSKATQLKIDFVFSSWKRANISVVLLLITGVITQRRWQSSPDASKMKRCGSPHEGEEFCMGWVGQFLVQPYGKPYIMMLRSDMFDKPYQ